MKYNSKSFKKINYFVLYDKDDEVVCYYDDFNELAKYLNYRLSNLVFKFNKSDSNMITIIIDNKEFKLATFC